MRGGEAFWDVLSGYEPAVTDRGRHNIRPYKMQFSSYEAFHSVRACLQGTGAAMQRKID